MAITMRNKIILASDSFKGSLTSLQVGEAAAKAVEAVMPEMSYEIIPVADGGEGTVEAIVAGLHGKLIEAVVMGPIGKPVTATYGICGETAVIEMAAASGLPLITEEERNPWITTSYGTGELIRDAIKQGCRKFLIGIGGSATNDAGIGMLKVLGFRFLDETGEEIGNGGGEAGRIVAIDLRHVMPELKECTFTVACDVTNPLTGPNGASYVFGPQKGADKEMVSKLDSSLASFARLVVDNATVIANHRGVVADNIGADFSTYPGAGAAGGLGFAFLAFLNATLQPGIDMVLDAVNFDAKLNDAALVITGEGRLDKQTCMGKTPYGVLKHSEKRDVPVIAIGGAVMPEAVPSLIEAGFKAVFPIVAGPIELSEALGPDIASQNVTRTVSQILRTLKLTL